MKHAICPTLTVLVSTDYGIIVIDIKLDNKSSDGLTQIEFDLKLAELYKLVNQFKITLNYLISPYSINSLCKTLKNKQSKFL